MTDRITSTPQNSDPGSHAAIGYDYQKELTLRHCLGMISGGNIKYVICEFHEDMIIVKEDLKLDLIQIKKKQNRPWTLNDLTKPTSGQEKGILAKLFIRIQNNKDIGKIAFWGSGTARVRTDELNLQGLIFLLKTEEEARDENWESRINEYNEYLKKNLESQGIKPETVNNAMGKLDINLGFPSPDAITLDNIKLLGEVIHNVYDVQLTQVEGNEIYKDIYQKVRAISHHPNQHWEQKTFNRDEIIELVEKRLYEFAPSASRVHGLNTQDKLSSVGLGEKSRYAFHQRLDARRIKYETHLSSSEWEDFRAEINNEITRFRKENNDVKGKNLWMEIRKIFSNLGELWASQKDKRFNRDFVEGVFFDMTGTCEANWMRVNND